MILFFQEERDRDFFDTCEMIRKESGYLSVAEIARKAVHTQAPSFYLSNRACAKIIIKFRRGYKVTGAMRAAKNLLYAEIYRLYKLIEEENPGMTAAEIARRIKSEKAPRFYITESRAIDLYYELLKNKPIR